MVRGSIMRWRMQGVCDLRGNLQSGEGFEMSAKAYADFHHLQRIDQVPFAAIMRRVGTRPALLDFLVPGLDLVIWKMRPCVREPVDMELRQSALRVLDHAVEACGCESGAMIYELDGYSFFAFRVEYRDAVLIEMGITEVLPG